jgi:sugar transferase (PEP-CTERM system associated)
MFSALRQHFSPGMIAQLAAEALWLFVVGMLVMRVASHLPLPMRDVALPALLFAMAILSLNSAFGIYRRAESVTTSSYLLRLTLAPAIGVPLAYVAATVVPGGWAFQQHVGLVVLFGIGGLLLLRHALLLPFISLALPHRVLVLGTGPEARLVEASLSASLPPGLRLLGFRPLDKVTETSVSSARVIHDPGGLVDFALRARVAEIIVAVRQQRGGVLPLRELLDCRLHGIEITDLARFFERVHGKVPIELLKVSWLIYGNGYRQGWLRTAVKRLFDLAAAASLLFLTLPIMGFAALAIRLESGGPTIYRQERVGFRGRRFTVFKFRSMAVDAEKAGEARWAVTRDPRVTRVGRVIRRLRVDELPQLFNVLRGEMSFVGPRPERPPFVDMLAGEIPFYAVRHSVKPGLTGWAQVRYPYGATVEQAVRKLEYDLYYVKNHTLALDVMILLETVRVVLLGEGAR